jgi:hypothetical protein
MREEMTRRNASQHQLVTQLPSGVCDLVRCRTLGGVAQLVRASA